MMLLIIGVCNVFVMHFESEPVVVVPAEDWILVFDWSDSVVISSAEFVEDQTKENWYPNSSYDVEHKRRYKLLGL
jgi:hypothetical protein